MTLQDSFTAIGIMILVILSMVGLISTLYKMIDSIGRKMDERGKL